MNINSVVAANNEWGRRCGGGRGRARWNPFSDSENPTAEVPNRRMMARFVKHVTLPDGTTVEMGSSATKTWRFRNDSSAPWPENCEIVRVGGDPVEGVDESIPIRGRVFPSEEIDVSVPLNAPRHSGFFQTFYRLKEVGGQKFGQRVWVSYVVPPPHSDEEKATVTNLNLEESLQTLVAMGFTNVEKNRDLLQRFHGNMERVVERVSDE